MWSLLSQTTRGLANYLSCPNFQYVGLILFGWSTRHRCQHVIISTNIVITSVSLEYLWPTTLKELNVSRKLSLDKLYLFFLTLIMRSMMVVESFQTCLIFLTSLLSNCATWQICTSKSHASTVHFTRNICTFSQPQQQQISNNQIFVLVTCHLKKCCNFAC